MSRPARSDGSPCRRPSSVPLIRETYRPGDVRAPIEPDWTRPEALKLLDTPSTRLDLSPEK